MPFALGHRVFMHAAAGAVVAGTWLALTWPVDQGTTAAMAVALLSLAVVAPLPLWLPQPGGSAPTPALHARAAGARPLLAAAAHGWRQARKRLAPALVVAALSALAATRAATARDDVLAPVLGVWFAAESGGQAAAVRVPPVALRGVIAEDATALPGGAVGLRLHVSDVKTEQGWLHAPGLVQLAVQGDMATGVFGTLTRGRPAEVVATLRWPAVRRNPGGAPPVRRRLASRYALIGTVKSALLVDVRAGSWWDEVPAAVRRYVRRTADERFGDDRRVTAAVVKAILIGDRSGLDADLTERLVRAGTYHVIAISGGNIAILTVVAVFLLRGVLRSPRIVPAAALLVVVAYGWVVHSEPSVLRAVTTAVVWLGAEAAGVRARPTRVFSLVVILVVALDPLMVIMPGAWLSFGATLGILLCAQRLLRAFRPAAGPGVDAKWRTRVRPLVALAAATVAAECVLLPVGAWTFSRVSAAGLFLNFLAIPAMAVVQLAGIAAMAPEWMRSVHAVASVATHHGVTVLTGSARFVDWLPWLAWRVPPPAIPVMVIYYAALVALLTGTSSRTAHRCALVIAGVMLGVIMTGPFVSLAAPAPGTVRVTILDVGQGEAIVVQLPGRHVMLVDGGAAGDGFDMGERVVAPALWALGARRVDSLVMTHAHADHAGGLPAVIADFAPAELWEGVPVAGDPVWRLVKNAAAGRGLLWREARWGNRWISGDAAVEVLHPRVPDWDRPRVRNDDSVVLRVRHGLLDLLLTGDIEAAGEADLPLHPPRAQAVRVLKVAHHGSRTSTSQVLLDRYRPSIAVVSAGRSNMFGHPAPDVLARLAAAGVAVFRTDRDGAVQIESDAAGVRVRAWTGRSWRVIDDPP